MKQQVNLYQPVLYPVRESLTLKRLVISWLVLIALLASGWFWLQQQQVQFKQKLASSQQQLTLQQQELAVFQQALA